MTPRWCRLADNPMAWMVQINDPMIDIRQSPPELQRFDIPS
jgi:hypothetical protein